MSTTTQILFNSPALHSLKREQLVKLCKIHALKANGKNVDLIQRLRQHAQTLPKDSPLSIAARSETASIQSAETTDTGEVDHMNQDVQEAEEEAEDQSYHRRVRPSEQWEVIMDSIEEVEESSSQGTLSSQRTFNGGSGEFGTENSKASTVGSSIRAFASSLGLKRTMSKPSTASSKISATGHSTQPEMYITNDDLAQNSTPYSALPLPTSLPQTDHFTLNTGRPSLDLANSDESPLPGHALRPGIPAPPNARLSLGLGLGAPATPSRQGQPTTTIRLVSNPLAAKKDSNTSYSAGEHGTPQLKPFQTAFDITFGSPVQGDPFNFGFTGLSSWPPKADKEDVEMSGLYPKLTSDDLAPSVVVSPRQTTAMDEDVQIPGALDFSNNSGPKALGSPSQFIFGSPNHRVSNHQFRDAAASVLEEMNTRLRADGVGEISIDIINKLHPDRKTAPQEPREIKSLPASKRGEISSRFDAAHEREFSKMEGINDTFKKRQERLAELSVDKKDEGTEKENVVIGKKRKSNVLESDKCPKRPSALANKPRTSTTRVISNGRRANAIPGGFGLEDDDCDVDDQTVDTTRPGKRIRADSEALTPEALRKEEEEQHEMELEKEAIRKKLEANRARRRSSAVGGRQSIGGAGGRKSIGRNGPRPSVLIKPKPKPSRFGFLASAKSLVQSVWSRGKTPAVAPPSNIPKATSITPKNVEAIPVPKEEKNRGKLVPPATFVLNKKSGLAPAKPTATNVGGNNNIARVPSTRLSTTKQGSTTLVPPSQAPTIASVASSRSRSRSPLPSFEDASTPNSSSGIGSGRNSLHSNASRIGSDGTGRSRTSVAAVSSIGNRLITGRMSNSSTVNSMGSRQILGGPSRTSITRTSGSSSSSTRQSTRLSSRLFAPTVSSLAKAAARTSAPAPTFASTLPSSENVKAVECASKDKEKQPAKATLGAITNSPVIHNERGSVISPSSPSHSGIIFSQPLNRSGIPTPVKKGLSNNIVDEALSLNASKPSMQVKRTLSGRKPRISRSKVIARLASQRSISGSSTASSNSSSSNSSALKPRLSSVAAGRTRSSLGLQAVSRASYGGAAQVGRKSRTSGGNGIAMALSAKRRARQSEYARRRSSRVGIGSIDKEAGVHV